MTDTTKVAVETKPYKGSIYDWHKRILTEEEKKLNEERYEESLGLGYLIYGTVYDHPNFGTTTRFRTSWVVSHNEDGNIETRNSRYKLVGKEIS